MVCNDTNLWNCFLYHLFSSSWQNKVYPIKYGNKWYCLLSWFWVPYRTNIYVLCMLTHWGRVAHLWVSILTIIGSDNGLLPGWTSHYLNQCWNIVNWSLRNKLQWNFNRNSYISIQENAFESVVCEMVAILSWPQCVNSTFTFISHCWFPANGIIK